MEISISTLRQLQNEIIKHDVPASRVKIIGIDNRDYLSIKNYVHLGEKYGRLYDIADTITGLVSTYYLQEEDKRLVLFLQYIDTEKNHFSEEAISYLKDNLQENYSRYETVSNFIFWSNNFQVDGVQLAFNESTPFLANHFISKYEGYLSIRTGTQAITHLFSLMDAKNQTALLRWVNYNIEEIKEGNVIPAEAIRTERV